MEAPYTLFNLHPGLYPRLLFLLFFYLVVMRGGGTSWSSYYLFRILGPSPAALLLAHPLILALVPVALVLRRWLPAPWLAVKYAGRVRSLDADVRANPENITARRNLAVIWLEKRRPQRALPLLDRALAAIPRASSSTTYAGWRSWAPVAGRTRSPRSCTSSSASRVSATAKPTCAPPTR
jgi:hypothetical protein